MALLSMKWVMVVVVVVMDLSEASEASWSDWHSSPCRAGCLAGSRAFMLKMRACVRQGPNGKMVKVADGCGPGATFMFDFCDDHWLHELCHTRMMDKEHYATRKCRQFSGLVPHLVDNYAMGMQPKHSQEKPRRACTIFCTSVERPGSWYAPVKELLEVSRGPRPFFPDGTLCHEDEVSGEKFFCQRTLCLPQKARWAGKSAKVPF